MAENLSKELRDFEANYDPFGNPAEGPNRLMIEAADLIEELEAKLARALYAGMEKAAVICESKFQSRNTVYEKSRRDAALEIRATIAELKGKQDD